MRFERAGFRECTQPLHHEPGASGAALLDQAQYCGRWRAPQAGVCECGRVHIRELLEREPLGEPEFGERADLGAEPQRSPHPQHRRLARVQGHAQQECARRLIELIEVVREQGRPLMGDCVQPAHTRFCQFAQVVGVERFAIAGERGASIHWERGLAHVDLGSRGDLAQEHQRSRCGASLSRQSSFRDPCSARAASRGEPLHQRRAARSRFALEQQHAGATLRGDQRGAETGLLALAPHEDARLDPPRERFACSRVQAGERLDHRSGARRSFLRQWRQQ